MQVFCKGFNLFGNFNCLDTIATDFIHSFDIENVECFELSYAFTAALIGQKLLIYGSDFPKEPYEIDTNKFGIVISLSANENMILVLNNIGEMYKISRENWVISTLPKLTIDNDKISKVKVGVTLNVAYSENGKVYSIPQELDFDNKTIIDLKVGREHCILLDIDGNVYTFGRGSRGQLGHGTLDDCQHPKIVEALLGIKIVQIAAGGWHSCGISEHGDLYSWGWNANGQLGLAEGNDEKYVPVMAAPHVVDIGNSDINIVKVDCGSRHTVTLLENGSLYGTGWNKYKQLTKNDEENYFTFRHIQDFCNKNVIALKCGPWSTAVICK